VHGKLAAISVETPIVAVAVVLVVLGLVGDVALQMGAHLVERQEPLRRADEIEAALLVEVTEPTAKSSIRPAMIFPRFDAGTSYGSRTR